MLYTVHSNAVLTEWKMRVINGSSDSPFSQKDRDAEMLGNSNRAIGSPHKSSRNISSVLLYLHQ
jgi:hypothetical protein